MARLLLATPDERQRTALSGNLVSAGHDVVTITNESDLLAVTAPDTVDCVIVSVELVSADGLDLITFLLQSYPGAPIVLLAPRERIEEAASAMRRGAYFYVLEPVNLDDLFHIVGAALRHRERLVRLRAYEQDEVEELLGDSPVMQRVVFLARKVAPTDASVLLLGESGVGKEVVAQIIHRLSARFEQPFVAINCSALPETLLESELFGHTKGAFTGATADRRGLFAEAHHGTVFLDEIGDLAVETQAKLLRVLQAGEVRRIGENTVQKVDVRILAATNQDLHALMEERRFREDLYFRLNVIQITIPPLRERRESIPRLMRQFLSRFGEQYGKQIVGVQPAAAYALAQYSYPGNVRELENMVEYAVIMADGHEIRLSDLPDVLQRVPQRPALPPPSGDAILVGEAEATGAGTREIATIAEMEQRHIAAVLAHCDGNQTVAAERLGISRSTLWRKMKEYGLRAGIPHDAEAS